MTSDDLLGTWDLLSWHNETPDGLRDFPLGREARGLISYTADGHVFLTISAASRAPFAANDPFGATAAEAAIAMAEHITYAGRYVIEGHEVVHHVTQASCPNWIGSAQRRKVTFKEGGILNLSATGAILQGREITAHLDWRRADATASP